MGIFNKSSRSYNTQAKTNDELTILRPLAFDEKELLRFSENSFHHKPRVHYAKVFEKPFASYQDENFFGVYLHNVGGKLDYVIADPTTRLAAKQKIINDIVDSSKLKCDPGLSSISSDGIFAYGVATSAKFNEAVQGKGSFVIFATSNKSMSHESEPQVARHPGPELAIQIIATAHKGEIQIKNLQLASYLVGHNKEFDKAYQEALQAEQSMSPAVRK